MPKNNHNQAIDKNILDLYSDYLISSFSQTTATGLAQVLDQELSHDKITRFLAAREYNSKDLWRLVKPLIRKLETPDGCLIFDDTIEEKAYTDENEIITWHFDHAQGRNVKGVNILSELYTNQNGTIPLAFNIVKKDQRFTDPKTGKQKRRATISKNEYFRTMFNASLANQIKFKYVLADSWFSAKENMELINTKKKYFIFAVKKNRLVAETKADKLKGNFKSLKSLNLKEGEVRKCFFKGMSIPVKILKQVFKNEDKSTGLLYLATNDLSLDFTTLTPLYQQRWKVEEYHKSIKSNTGLAKSPTKTVITQSNHFFASIYSFSKLEQLSLKTKLNHFALKSKLYLKALVISFEELQHYKDLAEIGVSA